MKEIKEKLMERYHKRRENKHSMTNLIVKIILLVLLISMIRFFGDKDEPKFRNIFKSFSHPNKAEIRK